jgi:hypothetical protein
MKKHLVSILFIITAVCWLQPSALAEAAWQQGILVQPLIVEGKNVGEAGELVKYRSTIAQSRSRHDVEAVEVQVGDRQLTEQLWWVVLPYDPAFSPAWVLRYTRVKQPDEEVNGNIPLDHADRVRVARNKSALIDTILREFPTHPLSENLWFARIERTAIAEQLETGGKAVSRSERAILDYLKQFPEGRFKPQAEWRLVQLRTEPYEYEGDAESILNSISVYEAFLRKHPKTPCSDEIRLRIAHLYRMAFESLTHPDFAEFNRTDDHGPAKAYREKAEAIYRQLLQSRNADTMASAQIALFNIGAGRRGYIGANDFW